jgi:hypothetical protein
MRMLWWCPGQFGKGTMWLEALVTSILWSELVALVVGVIRDPADAEALHVRSRHPVMAGPIPGVGRP